MESADIVLMHNELEKVRQATILSQRTLKTIKQNIGLSFIYNIIMVPAAMMAMVDRYQEYEKFRIRYRIPGQLLRPPD